MVAADTADRLGAGQHAGFEVFGVDVVSDFQTAAPFQRFGTAHFLHAAVLDHVEYGRKLAFRLGHDVGDRAPLEGDHRLDEVVSGVELEDDLLLAAGRGVGVETAHIVLVVGDVGVVHRHRRG